MRSGGASSASTWALVNTSRIVCSSLRVSRWRNTSSGAPRGPSTDSTCRSDRCPVRGSPATPGWCPASCALPAACRAARRWPTSPACSGVRTRGHSSGRPAPPAWTAAGSARRPCRAGSRCRPRFRGGAARSPARPRR
ncbi:conserved hypothetical protein [Ricinus communis]|uniref:Uncharacterized protein n=1 Tax=Ricinus communis TaxID=3988 RepID=B9TMJ0_RICCO|nr:conserved hypothetical protein [Ricinus communis]